MRAFEPLPIKPTEERLKVQKLLTEQQVQLDTTTRDLALRLAEHAIFGAFGQVPLRCAGVSFLDDGKGAVAQGGGCMSQTPWKKCRLSSETLTASLSSTEEQQLQASLARLSAKL